MGAKDGGCGLAPGGPEAVYHGTGRVGQTRYHGRPDPRLALFRNVFIGLQTDYELMQRRRQFGDKLNRSGPACRRAHAG